MTLQEFKSWFEGFTECMNGQPSAKQWKRVQKPSDIQLSTALPRPHLARPGFVCRPYRKCRAILREAICAVCNHSSSASRVSFWVAMARLTTTARMPAPTFWRDHRPRDVQMHFVALLREAMEVATSKAPLSPAFFLGAGPLLG